MSSTAHACKENKRKNIYIVLFCVPRMHANMIFFSEDILQMQKFTKDSMVSPICGSLHVSSGGVRDANRFRSRCTFRSWKTQILHRIHRCMWLIQDHFFASFNLQVTNCQFKLKQSKHLCGCVILYSIISTSILYKCKYSQSFVTYLLQSIFYAI